jgi:HD-GYP domain-containing protein (c-di-GMP phosphodiesterase class II)
VTVPVLQDELAAMQWILDEVRAGRPLPALEARAVAHALHIAMHSDGLTALPIQPLPGIEAYTSTHAVNVAIYAMAVCERLGFGEEYVLDVGVAALLQDIGSALVPREVLTKPDTLTDDERTLIKTHPVHGARALLGSEDSLDLAAVVAYEHHIRLDGGGYPSLLFPRPTHFVSRLVQICDVFDAVRTARPYKKEWPEDFALSFLVERGGFEFDAELVKTFIAVVTGDGSATDASGTSAGLHT